MPDAAQTLWLTDFFYPLRHLLSKPFFGFHFQLTDLLIGQASSQACRVRTDIPADHHEVIFVAHVVAVDQVSSGEISEL
jgi:hypothetical protein